MLALLYPPRLYRCSVIVPKFDEFTNFDISLYYGGPLRRSRPSLPYNNLIQNYNNLDRVSRIYTEAAINELLLWHEVKELELYLRRGYGLKLEYTEERTPIENNRIACTDQPSDSRKGYFLLNGVEDFSEPARLNFLVKAWYDKIPYY